MAGFSVNSIGNRIINNDLAIGDHNANAGGINDLIFQKSRLNGIASGGDILGTIIFSGNDGTGSIVNPVYIPGAVITATLDGSGVAAGQMPTNLTIATDSVISGLRTKITLANGGNVTIAAPDSGKTLTISQGATAGATDGSIEFPLNSDNRIFIGANLFEHSSGTNNVFLGLQSGNNGATITGTDNVGLGYHSLLAVIGGSDNVALGAISGSSLITGSSNVLIGSSTGLNLISGTNNIAIGTSSLVNATGGFNITIGSLSGTLFTTGNRNICVGFQSANNYVGAESDNIIINNAGVVSETNVMRLGTTGNGSYQISKTYIAGIYNVSVGAARGFAVVASDDQIGTVPSTVLAYTNVTHGLSPYTVLPTDYYLSCNTSGGVITLLLPNAPIANTIFIIKDRTGNAASNNITVTTIGGSVTIDGQTSYLVKTAYEAISVLFNGTSYEVF